MLASKLALGGTSNENNKARIKIIVRLVISNRHRRVSRMVLLEQLVLLVVDFAFATWYAVKFDLILRFQLSTR